MLHDPPLLFSNIGKINSGGQELACCDITQLLEETFLAAELQFQGGCVDFCCFSTGFDSIMMILRLNLDRKIMGE